MIWMVNAVLLMMYNFSFLWQHAACSAKRHIARWRTPTIMVIINDDAPSEFACALWTNNRMTTYVVWSPNTSRIMLPLFVRSSLILCANANALASDSALHTQNWINGKLVLFTLVICDKMVNEQKTNGFILLDSGTLAGHCGLDAAAHFDKRDWSARASVWYITLAQMRACFVWCFCGCSTERVVGTWFDKVMHVMYAFGRRLPLECTLCTAQTMRLPAESTFMQRLHTHIHNTHLS